nr:MAG TPA: hypothetical protein [Caudoviricetes sp.]
MNRAAQTSIPLLNNKHTHQETPWANSMGFNFVYITSAHITSKCLYHK